MLALVTVWAIRLAVYIGVRNAGAGEDFRYRDFARQMAQNAPRRQPLRVIAGDGADVDEGDPLLELEEA